MKTQKNDENRWLKTNLRGDINADFIKNLISKTKKALLNL